MKSLKIIEYFDAVGRRSKIIEFSSCDLDFVWIIFMSHLGSYFLYARRKHPKRNCLFVGISMSNVFVLVWTIYALDFRSKKHFQSKSSRSFVWCILQTVNFDSWHTQKENLWFLLHWKVFNYLVIWFNVNQSNYTQSIKWFLVPQFSHPSILFPISIIFIDITFMFPLVFQLT